MSVALPRWAIRAARRTPLPAVLVLTLGVTLAGAQAPTPAQPPDQVQAELKAVQDLLARATVEFDGPQQGRSIVLFDQIIEKLENLRRQGTLSPAAREILVRTYELQGRAYYNIGLQEKAAQVFRALIQLRPQHTLTKERVSLKVVEYFSSIKKALVGYLAVSSRPAGARVSLNGEFLSLTDFFPLEVLAGEYTVEVARDGYQTEVRRVSIAPRDTQSIEVPLVRTAASCVFVTQPAGVEVWIDGELRVTTAGSPTPDQHDGLRSKGLDPARSSGRTEVANLSLGSHALELRKKCYETVKTSLPVPEASDYDIDPVRLEESLASLRLTSEPPGAKIFLDGEAKGFTPSHIDTVCSGAHHLEVKHAAGKYLQDFVLARNEELALDCPIRPTLALLGVIAAGNMPERALSEAEEKVAQNLAKVRSLNIVRPPREHVDRVLESEHATIRDLVPGSSADAETVRRVTEKLAGALEVQGFLIVQLPEERLQRVALLHLLAAGNSVADSKQVLFAESASYSSFLSDIDRLPALQRTWAGLITVDAKLAEGVPVLRVVPGSPAAGAEIQPGEIVYSVEGSPVTQTADLGAVIAGKKPGETLALHLKGPAGTRTAELTLGVTPQEVPLNDGSILYNRLMMDLRQQVEGYPNTEPAALARLNLALCSMHFRDYVAAHEHLVKARSELPQRPGISQGTALYYLGLTLERLNYPQDARVAYRGAVATEATVHDNDGLTVAELAARRIEP
jgi:tetratricopeptide (TPR) repeat protein